MPQTYHKVRTYREPVAHGSGQTIEDDNIAVIADTNPVITKIQMVVQFILGIIVSLLVLRLLLALFGANAANGFVDFIYGITSPLVAPFEGLFSATATSGTAQLELKTLMAVLIYSLIGIGIVRLVDIFRRQPN